MPYAMNRDVRIFYQRHGSGPPLILHPAFSGWGGSWRDFGYTDPVGHDRELILLDPRGQGASDKSHDPAAYTFDQRVADVLAVLDHAGIARAAFWGYSLGGHVGYAIRRYAPERFSALVIGGTHPFARDPEQGHRQAAALRVGGMEAWVAGFEAQVGRFPEPLRSGVLANDPEALAAVSIASAAAPDFGDVLERIDVPVLLYMGECDPMYPRAREAARPSRARGS